MRSPGLGLRPQVRLERGYSGSRTSTSVTRASVGRCRVPGRPEAAHDPRVPAAPDEQSDRFAGPADGLGGGGQCLAHGGVADDAVGIDVQPVEGSGPAVDRGTAPPRHPARARRAELAGQRPVAALRGGRPVVPAGADVPHHLDAGADALDEVRLGHEVALAVEIDLEWRAGLDRGDDSQAAGSAEGDRSQGRDGDPTRPGQPGHVQDLTIARSIGWRDGLPGWGAWSERRSPRAAGAHAILRARGAPVTCFLVALAQSAEHRIVAPKVTGSIPVGHPTTRSSLWPGMRCALARSRPTSGG